MASYASVSELKSYVNELTAGVQSSFTGGEDALLQVFLDEATAEIERQTGRKFIAVVGSRYFGKDAFDGKILYLDADLYSLQTITNGDGTTIGTGDTLLHPLSSAPYYAIQLGDGSWSLGDSSLNTIEIHGDWGFSEQPPADIKRACKRLAYFYWMKRTATGERAILNEFQTTEAAEYPADVMSVLRRYKRGTIR